MQKEEQERWNKMVSGHWWIRGHHNIARGLINKYLTLKKEGDRQLNCLDIGCSGGYMLDFLSNFGRSYGMDISLDGLKYCKNNSTVFLQADATNVPFKSSSFDTVILLEVAEHVENDYLLFHEIQRVCKESALVFVMVPAYKFLWGSHDVKYSHKRRYERKPFLNLVSLCGFKIKRLTYMHPHLLIPLMFLRFFDRLEKKMGLRDDFMSLGKFLDNMLYKTLMLENKMIQNINFPFGTCMYAILEKNE